MSTTTLWLIVQAWLRHEISMCSTMPECCGKHPDIMCVQEPSSITLEPCTRFVDDWVTVSEPEIAAAMLGIRDHHGGMLLEGMSADTCQRVT